MAMQDMAGLGGSGTTPASPEEQAQYDQFVKNAMTMIYDDKMTPQILQNLEGGGNPMQGLARTTAMIVHRIEGDAERQGKELADGVVFNAGIEIGEDLADLQRTAGIADLSDDQMEQATYMAMDEYRNMGGMDPKKAQAELADMQAMDESGELDRVAPGLREKAMQASGAPPPQAPPANPQLRGLGG